MTDKANETPESIGIRVARTHLLHARQINAVEESVNMHMGGDATVGELVSLMIVMGWKPPGDQAVGAEFEDALAAKDYDALQAEYERLQASDYDALQAEYERLLTNLRDLKGPASFSEWRRDLLSLFGIWKAGK